MKRIIRRIRRLRIISIKNLLSKCRVFSGLLMKNNKLANATFLRSIDDLVANISDSNGSNYYKKADINVGIITDEYMYNYYKDAVNLVYLTPDGYKETFDNNRIDMVLFVTCWHGMGNTNDWRGVGNRKSAIDIFSYAKEKGIRTVFQSIEDPSNYDVFIDIAKEAEYIFTSCTEKVCDYKKDTLNDNVFVLDYGVNPIIHNPIGFLNKHAANVSKHKKNNVFFAGSWAPRYKERCEDMCMIFDGVLQTDDANLIIADRNMYIKGYNFPIRYSKYLIPPIKHITLQKVHKLFDWTVNINSIKNSLTMCAMRVYEVQALGSLLISNYALSVSNAFPNIFNVFESAEIRHILKGYTNNQIISMQIAGIRNVMSKHTVYDKLNGVFEAIHFDYRFRQKRVLVLCEKKTDAVIRSFNRQSYPEKKLFDYSGTSDISKGNYDYLIIFQDGKEYGVNYITDLIGAFKYTDSAYTVYANDDANILPYNYVKNTNTLFDTMYDISEVDLNDIKNLPELELEGFMIKEQPFDLSVHTVEKLIGVIIPVYNNGEYLQKRCLASLMRSSIFDKMQLYIIDDGSTDTVTINSILELEKQYSNITSYYFNDGGSGSASRPRNKGIELCREKYVTYLDPDNEAINDGYAKLMMIVEQKKVDMAFGTILKVSDKKISKLSFMYHDTLISAPRQELLDRKFKSQSIQACLIKKDLITKNHISNPVGAAGQDTLFFYELLMSARSVYHVTLSIHIYYAQRENSIVNTINKTFFEKFLLLEKYQIQTLKRYGVLDEYLQKKFNCFLKNWYYEKLEQVDEENREVAAKIVDSIIALYSH